MQKTEKTKKTDIELGDFIQITAPTNTEWHEQTFFVAYIDTSVIEIVHLLSYQSHFLKLSNKRFLDESIAKITVLSRSSLKGYARQNGLHPHIWVDIFFGGEIPKIITAEITNLEEDMIELNTYPENKILFIDFAYQGIPRNIPLERICIREKPSSFKRFSEDEGQGDGDDDGDDEGQDASVEYTKEGMMMIELPDKYNVDENYHEQLQKIYIRYLQNEELPEIIQQMEIAPELQKYGLEAQVNDLLDHFLSTIPDYKRTPTIMNKIFTHIQRFKELRELFSRFDANYHNILGPKKMTSKPLIQTLENMNTELGWCIPVVNNIKKIYFLNKDGPLLPKFSVPRNLSQINMTIDGQAESKSENDIFYQNERIDDTHVKYANMFLQNAEYYFPFYSVPPEGESEKIHTIPQVKHDIDVIVSNEIEDNLTSTNSAVLGLYQKRFGFSRYHREIQYPYKRNFKSKEASLFKPLFLADSLDLRSILILPEPFIRFSKIHLPNTSIFQRAEYHLNYPFFHHFLHKKTVVEDTEISFSSPSPEIRTSLNTIQHVKLSKIDEKADSFESAGRYTEFLNHVVPSVDVLLDTFLNRPYYKKLYTFLSAVETLEPFSIYMEHIPWKDGNKLKNMIYKNIDAYLTNTTIRSELFKALLLEKYKSELSEHRNFLQELLEKEKKSKEIYTDIFQKTNSSEFLAYILDTDQSKFFSSVLQHQMVDLYVPEAMIPSDSGDSGDLDPMQKSNSDCWKRVITKKYKSVSDLTADNGKDIYYDKEFDTTDYSLVDKYREEQPELDDMEFLNFLAENLISKNGISRDHAFTDAKNMISGEKLVQEGEFAVLIELPHLELGIQKDTLSNEEKEDIRIEADAKKRVMYYSRRNNNWVHIPDLDEYSFIDNNTLFCNLQENCYGSSSDSKKKSKSKAGVCEDETTTIHRIYKENKARILEEFKNRYDLSVEEFSQTLLQKQDFYELEWKRSEKIRYMEKIAFDTRAFEYGTRAQLSELLFSPYLSLRDSILEKHLDFTTRNNYILLFVDRFCREPLVEEPMSESPHWFYCKETNTQLMPKSLFLLAKAYFSGSSSEGEGREGTNTRNKYTIVLNQLCNTIGKLSDDGDAFVDKYSGYILMKRELVDEGISLAFETVSENIEESETTEDVRDYLQMIQHQSKKPHRIETERVFQNEIDQKIYNLISSICKNIYVFGQEHKDKMMVLCQQWLKIPKLFISKDKYQEKINVALEKRKNNPKLKIPDDFETYCKKQYIYISTLSVLIVVQTAIPMMDIKRTFPGCVKSFSGYPLNMGQEDMSTIKYFSCVLKKIYTDNKEEKNLVPKKIEDLELILFGILKDTLLLQPNILKLYDDKRQYIRTLPDSSDIDSDNAITVENRWPHFLPPLSPFTISSGSLEKISPPDSEKGKQRILNIYLVKNQILSLSVVLFIREILTRKQLLFQSKSGKPHLQNACCDDILHNPSIPFLQYFENEDPAIAKTIEILRNLGDKIDELREKSKALYLRKPLLGSGTAGTGSTSTEVEGTEGEGPTKKDKQNIIFSYDTEVLYAALIHYCKLNSDIYPIPRDLDFLCSKKPVDPFPSISTPMIEKIDFLEKNKIRTDARKTIALMNTIHQRHPVSIIQSIDVSPKNKMQMALEDFRDANLDIPSISEEIEPWLDTLTTDTEGTESFDFLERNQEFKESFFSFINIHAPKKPTMSELNVELKVLYDWNNYKNIPLSNMFSHMRSIFVRFAIIYPSYLLSSETFGIGKLSEKAKHWKLIPSDYKYLQHNLQTYTLVLNQFKKDEILEPIFEKIVDRIHPLFEFLDSGIFSVSALDKEGDSSDEYNRKKNIYEMCLFCIHLCFEIWMKLADHPDIYRIITKRIREKALNDIEESTVPDIIGENEDEEEFDSELQEVDITNTFSLENTNNTKQRLAELFLAMMKTIRTKEQVNDKEAVMMTYADIMKEVDYSRDREKQKIKKYFTDLSTEERKAELILKKLHLGIFAVDQNKLNKYGKYTGMFGDKDEIVVNKSVLAAREKEQEMEDLSEIQEFFNSDNMDVEGDIFGDDVDEDVDGLQDNIPGDEEDYEDMNEYAYENNYEE